MRSYTYYSMLAMTGAYGYTHYDLSDIPGTNLYQVPHQDLLSEVESPKPRKGLLRILLSLISFNRF